MVLKVYRFQKRALLLTELTDVSIDAVVTLAKQKQTRMWANAQRDGRPSEYRWRPVLNAAKFGSRPLLDCRAVTLPM